MSDTLFDVKPEPPKPHTLIARHSPEVDGLTYDIECPGVTAWCRAWRECQTCTELDDFDAQVDDLVERREVHGEVHEWLPDADAWCVPTPHCLACVGDGLADAVDGLVTEPGRYAVGVTFEPNLILELLP